MLVWENVVGLQIFSDEQLAREGIPAWRENKEILGGLEPEAGDEAEISSHNLPVIEDIAVCRTGDTWWVEGRNLLPAGAGSQIFAVLEAHGGGRRYFAPIKRVGANNFVVVGRLDALSFGHYGLKILHLSRGEAIFQATGTRLFRVPADCDRRFIWQAVLPGTVSLGQRKSVKGEFVIDDITLLNGSEKETQNLVYIRGWSYTRNLGRAIFSFTSWPEAEGPTFCVSEQFPRPDLVTGLGSSHALMAGFELCAPIVALRNEALRIYQRYENQTVEFLDFGGVVAKEFNNRILKGQLKAMDVHSEVEFPGKVLERDAAGHSEMPL